MHKLVILVLNLLGYLKPRWGKTGKEAGGKATNEQDKAHSSLAFGLSTCKKKKKKKGVGGRKKTVARKRKATIIRTAVLLSSEMLFLSQLQ